MRDKLIFWQLVDKIIHCSDARSLKNLRSTCRGIYAVESLNRKLMKNSRLSIIIKDNDDADKFYGLLSNSIIFPSDVSVDLRTCHAPFQWNNIVGLFQRFGQEIQNLSLFLAKYRDLYWLKELWLHLNQLKSLELNFNLCLQELRGETKAGVFQHLFTLAAKAVSSLHISDATRCKKIS